MLDQQGSRGIAQMWRMNKKRKRQVAVDSSCFNFKNNFQFYTQMKNRLQSFLYNEGVEAGVDEAGRGCLAGPVVAAAVILPPGFHHPLLFDSKQVKEKDRDELRKVIEREATAWAVGRASIEEIDAINILQATYLAMHRAIAQLHIKPELLVIDGNRFKPYPEISHEPIIGGDAKFAHIAAASILAKTHRDEYMLALHSDFPEFGWDSNKGYGTTKHVSAIERKGQTIHHRRSFILKNKQLSLS
jgi:ribonuclease HII